MEALQNSQGDRNTRLIEEAMLATDFRFHNNLHLNPGFLLAVLLWPAVQRLMHASEQRHKKLSQALHFSVNAVLAEQSNHLKIPRRLMTMMSDIWILQYHLKSRRGRRVYRTISHRYYRAAIDFMMLRVKSGETLQPLIDWWKTFQSADNNAQQTMLRQLVKIRDPR